MRRRLRTITALLATLMIGALVGFAPGVAAASPPLSSFSISGSPFAADFAPLPASTTLTAVLTRPATVRVTIRRHNGALLRRLAYGISLRSGSTSWSWDGADAAGSPVRDGQYIARIVATSKSGTQRAERPLRKGLPVIYPRNPGALVIVVDPGHGGRFPGAVNGVNKEKDFNLDIGLKLGALLERAGVQVIMTRATDVAVNQPPSDLNGDGVLDRYDDDLARNDIANLARADVAVHVHNNAALNVNARGTGTYTAGDRTWTPSGLELASDVLSGVAGTLESYRSASFKPKNTGVHTGWYYYMGPYDPPFLIRSALMTSVLSESLFVSNATELETLKRPDVRLAIAAGIYLGVASYLNTRDYGVGYELVSGPSSAVAGNATTYQVRVTNRGNVKSQGWQLTLSSVPAVPLYDGSGAHGTQIGAALVPDGLAPGDSVAVTVPATAPSSAGDWLVKSDILVSGGQSLAYTGIAPLQFALTTTIAP